MMSNLKLVQAKSEMKLYIITSECKPFDTAFQCKIFQDVQRAWNYETLSLRQWIHFICLPEIEVRKNLHRMSSPPMYSRDQSAEHELATWTVSHRCRLMNV